jgi:hypothetical protein
MDIETRLVAVETSLRRTRAMNLALLLGVTVLTVGGARSNQDSITARQLTIVDGQGRERVLLTGDDNGMAGVRVFDAAGQTRISAGVAADNSSYTQWFDTEGRSRLAAMCSQSGQSSLQWRDADGKLRIGGATMLSGESSMMWLAPNGKPQIRVLTDGNGTAKFLSGE